MLGSKLKLFILIFFLIFTKAFSSDIYLQCEEKISDIKTDSNSKFRVGKIIGTSFVEINTNSGKPRITIYYKEKIINQDQK